MTKDDYVIICGDFGGVWDYKISSPSENYWLDWLNDKPFTTLFVDGNHECLHKDTEVLTSVGWIKIEDIYNSNHKYLVASVDLSTHSLTYSEPLRKVRSYAEYLIDFNGTNYRQCVTPNHDIVVNGKKIKAEIATQMDLKEWDFRFNIDDSISNEINYSNEIIEILTMTIMDGTIVEEKKYHPNSKKVRIQFHLKKIRKIIYLQNLLDSNNIKYTISHMKDGTTYIRIYGDYARYLCELLHYKKEIPPEWRKLSDIQFRYFLNGLVNSDGTPAGNNIKWVTTSKSDVDIVTEQCIFHNYDISVRLRDCASGYADNCKLQYIISIGKNKEIEHKVKIDKIDYNDYAYCLTMEDGTLITRYKLIPCITGNCFDRLKEFPRVKFHGGMAHQIRSNIYHLMRGYVFEFEGKKFFTFGGASSHDIQDGILDLKDYDSLSDLVDDYNKRTRKGEMLRINHISWWKDELPTSAEMKRGIENLKKVNFEVDYVISHCLPQSVISIMYPNGSDKLTRYFDSLILDYGLRFKKWYCGHYHEVKTLLGKYDIHYEDIERIL